MKEIVTVVSVNLVNIPGQQSNPQFSYLSAPLRVMVANERISFPFFVDGLQSNPKCGDVYEIEITKVPQLGNEISL